MDNNNHIKHLSSLLLATLFISTSGVLGKYIAMPTELIIWFRSAIGMAFLFLYCKIKKVNYKVAKKAHPSLILSSVFLGAHWITYFYALKLSNVAIGILSLYTFPVITAILEPLFVKTKLNPIHILFGFMVLLGIYILAPEFNLESSYTKGILFGVFSAILYAIRILILKKHVENYNGTFLMFYQTFTITILLIPTLFFMDLSGLESQYPYLLILGIITTAIGHSLMVQSLKFFSATTTTVISSVQPIFGIALAFFFLNEIPTWNTFVGGLLIIITVAIESIRSRKH